MDDSAPDFDSVTDWHPVDGVRTGTVPPQWMQGRAAFGGLSAGVLVRTMRDRIPDLPLRSMHVDFIGPLTGDAAHANAELIREGRSLSHVRAEIVQAGTPRARATASFGGARPSSIQVRAAPAGERPEPSATPPMPYIRGIIPAFAQFVDMAFCEGGHPFSGAGTSHLAGWCRHRTTPGPPEVALMGLLDAWPAPVLAQLDAHAPASTVSWTSRFIEIPDRVGTDDWFWYRSSASHAGDGYAHMEAALWDRGGRPIARLEQLVAVFDGR